MVELRLWLSLEIWLHSLPPALNIPMWISLAQIFLSGWLGGGVTSVPPTSVPPDNCPPGQLSPRTFVPPTFVPLDKCPPRTTVPPGQLSPQTFVPLDICPPRHLSPWTFVPLSKISQTCKLADSRSCGTPLKEKVFQAYFY